MQHSPVQLKEKLLQSLDEEHNVIDMPGVLQVISALEASPITREVLEQTRIGKFVNEMRRKTKNKDLAKRAKNLVRLWQQQVMLSTPTTSAAPPAPPHRGGTLNGEGLESGAPRYMPEHLRAGSKQVSPASGPPTPAAAGSATTSPRSTGSRPGTPGLGASNTGTDPHNNNNNSSKLSHHHHYTVDTSTSGKAPVTGASNTPTLSKTDAANKRKRHRNGGSPVENERPAKVAKHERRKGNKNEFVANGAVSKNYSPDDLHVSASVDSAHSNSCDSQPRSAAVVSPVTTAATKGKGRHGDNKHKTSPPNLIIKRNSTVPARLQHNDSDNKLQPRTPKVKTTAELIQEMSASGGLRVAGSRTAAKIVLNQIAKEKDDIDSPVVPPEAKPRFRRKPGSSAIMPPVTPGLTLTQTKNEMMEKFLQSQSPHPATQDQELPDYLISPEEQGDHRAHDVGKRSRLPPDGNKRVSFFVGDDDVETSEVKDESSSNKTAVDPWSLLPPLNLADIDWTTDEYKVYPPKPVEDDDVEHLEQDEIPGVNGQVDGQGSWHDWTRTITVPSFNNDPLHILPYISIDD